MKCHICDREDSLIQYDKEHQEFTPCTICKEAIDDCISSYGDEDEPNE